MTYPLLVIYARASGLYGLPCEYISYCVITKPPQPGKVYVSILLREWSLMEADVVPVEEIVGDLGGLVEGLAGILGVSGNVDTTEDDLPPGSIDKLALLNEKTKWGHGGRTGAETGTELMESTQAAAPQHRTGAEVMQGRQRRDQHRTQTRTRTRTWTWTRTRWLYAVVGLESMQMVNGELLECDGFFGRQSLLWYKQRVLGRLKLRVSMTLLGERIRTPGRSW